MKLTEQKCKKAKVVEGKTIKLSDGGSIPSSQDMIAQYLVDHANTLSMATLSRRMVAIGKAHTMQGHPSPTQSDIVQLTLKGIKRNHGKPQRQVSALLKEDIISMLNVMPHNKKGLRDRAMLLVGFCGAFRREKKEMIAAGSCSMRCIDITSIHPNGCKMHWVFIFLLRFEDMLCNYKVYKVHSTQFINSVDDKNSFNREELNEKETSF